MSILVIGATGNVGRRVLEGLLVGGRQVRATSRTPGKVHWPAGVTAYASDLAEPETLRAALADVERVFLYAQMTDPEAVVGVLREEGVQRVVLLSSAAVTDPSAETDYNGSRFLQAERAIEGAGLTYTFLRPGAFAHNASGWASTIKHEHALRLPYPDAVQVPIHERDIAAVAVIALTTDTLRNAAPVLTGPERLTLRAQVATISEAIGEAITLREQSEEEAFAFYTPFIGPAIARVLIHGWRDAVGASPEISPSVETITGHKGHSFKEWVNDHIDLYR